LNGLSTQLIESHYENNYGGALRRLNAITERLESLDFATTPGYVINGLKRDELIALNSTLLHELYFASLGGDGKPTPCSPNSLHELRSADRWRSEFVAMANGLAGGSGWVLLAYVPRDRRLVNQYAADHGQSVASGIPVLALDMYGKHAYHIDFGANAAAVHRCVHAQRRLDCHASALRGCGEVDPPRPLVQENSGDLPGVDVEEVKAMLDAGKPVRSSMRAPAIIFSRSRDIMDGRRVARSRPRAGLDRRAFESRSRRRVLRVWLSCRMQDRHCASRSRTRRDVHAGRPLGMEGVGGATKMHS
jgi:Fe-Mn family superoxide dismutase